MTEVTYREAVREAMTQAMRADQRVFLMAKTSAAMAVATA